MPPTRISSIDGMNIPTELGNDIQSTIEKNRMLFEPWVESASNFQELKESLKSRGYKNLPNSSSPIHEAISIPKDLESRPKVKQLSKRKTMLRRASKI